MRLRLIDKFYCKVSDKQESMVRLAQIYFQKIARAVNDHKSVECVVYMAKPMIAIPRNVK